MRKREKRRKNGAGRKFGPRIFEAGVREVDTISSFDPSVQGQLISVQ